MRSHRIPIAALLPRKLGGRSESCGTCFTARSLTSIGSFMRSMKGGQRCGCSRFAMAHDESSSRPTLNKRYCLLMVTGKTCASELFKRPSQEFSPPCETVVSCESRSQRRNLMRSGSASAAPLKNHRADSLPEQKFWAD